VTFIAEGTISTEQVLQDMVTSVDKKMKIKLPKVLDKQTGQKTLAPFRFSSANWNSNMEVYKESVHK